MNNAAQLAEDALTRVESTPKDQRESSAYASRLNNLAVSYQALGRFDEADLLYKQSLAIWERVLGPAHLRIAQSLSNRASLYRLVHEFHEAENIYQRSLNLWYTQGFPKEAEMAQTALSDDSPLWAEQIDGFGVTRQFRARVQDLRRRVESGAPGAKDKLIEMLRKLGPWYHNINYAGIDTNPQDPDYPARRWRILEPFIPKDLSEKTILDIGCNAGYFSLDLKKRGAKRVMSIDFMAHLVGQVRFGSYWFDLPIEPRLADVYDVESLGVQFDMVVFVGVLYHLKHPLYALEKVANVCKDTLFFQSLMRGPVGDFTPADDYSYTDQSFFEHPNYPKLYFLEKSFNTDDSNWWIATQSCLKAMLRVSGFGDITDTAAPDHFVCRKKN
jgi:tRNA (mo5U34)-methyltransferase